MELCYRSLIRLHGVMLNYVQEQLYLLPLLAVYHMDEDRIFIKRFSSVYGWMGKQPPDMICSEYKQL
jgi:hypothetical protein